MASTLGIGGEWGPFLVVPLCGALAVVCAFLLGAMLSSRTAGLVAAGLLATSPVFLFQLVQPMSDVPATALWALAVLLALSPRAGAHIASGATAGLALLTRPNLLPLALVLPLAAAGWLQRRHGDRRASLKAVVCLTLGALPAAGTLLLMQWRAYGSPLASGHGAFSDFFALANVWPNVHDYTARLVRGEAPALLLAAVGASLCAAVRRDSEIPRQMVPGVRTAVTMSGALLVCYLPYGVFPDWSYLRFFLPAFPMAFVVVGALLVSATDGVPRPFRGLALLLAVTLACATNVRVARAEEAFNLRRYEARYRTVGRYLDALLPPSAVVIALQESAAVSHYTHRPVVRWDLLRVDLDQAVSELAALGRTPVLVVEDWEAAGLKSTFPASGLATLDWQPRADLGSDTRVRLFDPTDRGRPSGAFVTDRFE
jgi:4-amino-4-deoxy-L-arabinose transferase-like glycosyltransferase